jgi:hypothetical protein
VFKTNATHQQHIAVGICAQMGSMMSGGHVTGLVQKLALHIVQTMNVFHLIATLVAIPIKCALQVGKQLARPMLHAHHGICEKGGV